MASSSGIVGLLFACSMAVLLTLKLKVRFLVSQNSQNSQVYHGYTGSPVSFRKPPVYLPAFFCGTDPSSHGSGAMSIGV